MKRLLRWLLFFVGLVLSPFTWWNDAFINIPFSYIIANALFYITAFPFKWLVIGSYWFTNILGLFFMYFGGKHIVLSSKNKMKAIASLIIFVLLYSAIMIYLDRQGKLLPLCKFFERYRIDK